jgi:uncharacterized protein YjbI with pentapeptide repeats
MTVECWFKTTDTNNQKLYTTLLGRNVSGGVSSTSQFSIYMLSTGEIGWGLTNAADTGSFHTTTATYKDALWHHVACTYNSTSGTKIIYVDGVLSRTDAVPGGFGLLSNNSTVKLVFGSDAHTIDYGSSLAQFRGYLSDIRIWNVVRSAADISNNFRQRLIGNETGLVGYWELNQGYGTGWGSYSTALDNTSNRANGTLLNMGSTPSGSWVLSNLYFQPRFSTLTLGPKNGVYPQTDISFSFIDPSSNSRGDFTYAISSGAVATISNGAATTKTVFSTSGSNLVTTLSLFEFPEIASLASWQIDLSFTVTGGTGTWRALIGDMYNEINSGGWGMWVSAYTPPKIHWSWQSGTVTPDTITVNLNTPYVLTAAQTGGVITMTLQNLSGTYNTIAAVTDTTSSISNLVALYNFDSNANDSSTNGNNLTNVNTVTYNLIDNIRGSGAASFNGSNYFERANDGRFSPDNFTVSFWIKPVSGSTYQSIVTCRNGFNLTGWMIYINGNNNLEFITGNGGSVWSYGSEDIYSGIGTINTWVHIAFTMTKSTNTVVAYINGSMKITFTRLYSNNTAYPLRIGAGADFTPAELFVRNGTLIDDFRFYNKVLSASEIRTIVSPVSSLVASYNFDSNANDSSVNGNTLTNVGSVTYNTTDYKRGTAAASFNGSNYFEISNNGRFSPDTFTVALWIKPASHTSYQSIASCRGSSPWRGWMMYIGPSTAGSNLEIWSSTDGSNFTGQTSVISNFGTLNIWVHVAFTLNKSTSALVVYMNGIVVTTTTLGYTNNTGTTLRIGAGANEQSALFNLVNGSLIDDFRFYNKVLIPSEINSLVSESSYSSSFSMGGNVIGKGPVTIGGWRLNSGENFPGTISYVNVSVPTNQRVVTIASSTGETPATITATQAGFLDFASGTKTASLTVTAITPTFSTSFANITKTVNESPFSLDVPVSNSIGAFSFTSSNTAVATINPATVINALQFNGTTNFIDFGSNITELGKASFTIECWVKTSGTSMGLLNCQDSDTLWESGEKSLYIDSAGLPTFVGFGNDWIYSTRAINDNAWHHIAVTWAYSGSGTSGTSNMYIDGIQRSAAALSFIGNNTSYLRVPYNSALIIGTADFTIEWYQYQTDNNGAPRIFEFNNNRSPGVSLEGGRFYWWSAFSTNNSAAITFKNTWVHFAVVRISGTITIYRNGSSILTFSDTTNYTTSSDLIIGCQANISEYASLTSFGGQLRYFHFLKGIGKYTGTFTPVTTSQTATVNTVLLIDNNVFSGTLGSTVINNNVTLSSLSTYAANNNNTGTFVFGKPSYSESVNFFNGAVCELRIWNVARSAADIYQNYRRMLVGDETGLVAYNRFNQGTAGGTNTGVTTVTNNDLNGGFTGTLSGTFALTGTSSNWVSGLSIRPTNDVNVVGAGTTTITATQQAIGDYASLSTTATLTVSKFASTLGALSILSKTLSDPPFILTAPTSTISSIISPISTITSTASLIVPPPDIRELIYGSSWTKRGEDIDGEFPDDNSGFSVTISADGNVIAVGGRNNDGSGNDLPNAFYLRTGGSNWRDFVPLLTANSTTNLLGWGPDAQFNDVNVAPQNEIAKQFAYFAGYWLNRTRASSGQSYSIPAFTSGGSVGTFTFTATSNYPVTSYTGNLTGYNTTTYTLTAQSDGNTAGQNVAYNSNIGHVRVYRYNSTKIAAQFDQSLSGFGPIGWDRVGGDIDGESAGDYSGTSVSLSANGNIIAIGAYLNGATGANAGHVRVYKFNSSKTTANTLGPAGWDKLGGDIDGEAAGDQSGGNGWDSKSVSISADGTTVAIAAFVNDGNGIDSGQVRVYKYNSGKVSADGLGPAGWDKLGGDIDGEATNDQSGYAIGLSADGTIVAIGAYGNDGAGDSAGHVRVYKYTPTKTLAVTVQTDLSFGPIGWNRLGADIDGEFASDRSGTGIGISADGTIVAIGAHFQASNTGHVRVYKYTPSKTVAVTLQTDLSFGPIGWNRLGADIDGEGAGDFAGACISLSADGTVVAIGANENDGFASDAGHVRVYKYTPSKTVAVTSQSDISFGPIGWNRLGLDIDGEAANDRSGQSVALSSDGTTLVIGSRFNDGTSGSTTDNRGHARVYNISTTNALTYTSSNSSIADVCGNILLIKGVNGISTITASQTGNTINGRLDVSGTSYTLQYNPFSYTSSNTSVATVTTYGTVSIVGSGTSTITATQPETLSYESRNVTAPLTVSSLITPTITNFNAITKIIGDASFNLVDPSSNSVGAFTYASSNGAVATILGRVVTIVGAGTSTITASQDASGVYGIGSSTALLTITAPTLTNFNTITKTFGDASFNLVDPSSNSVLDFTYSSSNTQVATIVGRVVTIIGPGTSTITAIQGGSTITASLIVAFGNLSSISTKILDGPFVLPTPISNVVTTYGSTWNKVGSDIAGNVTGDESGTSLSISADGTVVAIGARSNTSNRGTVRVYKYNNVSWTQMGSDINGEASSDYSGQSVSLSANGTIVAIGANYNDGDSNLRPDSGHVRIYEFNGSSWVQRGGDIDGEASADQSGISVSLSEDGTVVAIGAIMNDGSGNLLSNSGHVRVYKYNSSKSASQLTNQDLSTFGPVGWDRLGADIDGEAVDDQSGFSVSISANGTILAIGAIFNDGTSGTVNTGDNRGHVRVYKYNSTKTNPQLTNQGLSTYGPAGWDRLGSDIDGEAATDQTGFSVSLSSDGSTVAVGSPFYDAGGVSNAGRVRVFAWNGSSWVQRGGNINGVNISENLGDSVSLSADGMNLSVSSFMKVVNYNYNLTTTTWSQIGSNITVSNTNISIIKNVLVYNPLVYLDGTNTSSYNGSTWTNLGSLGGNISVSASSMNLSSFYSALSPYLSEFKNSNFYEYTLDGSDFYISDGGGDMYDGGNYSQVRVDNNNSGNLSYSQTTATTTTLNGKSVDIISLGYTRPLTMLAFCSQRANFGMAKYGNIGADGGGSQSSSNVYTGSVVNGYTVYAWVRVIYNAWDPSVGDLYFVLGNSSTIFYNSTMNTYADASTDGGTSYMTMDCEKAVAGTILLSKPSGTFITVEDCQAVLTNLTSRAPNPNTGTLTFDANDNGGAFIFNGSTTTATLNVPSTTLTSLTYVAVVKTTGLTMGWASVLDFGNDNLLFGTSANVINFYNPTVNSGFTLTAGVWYFIAVTIATNGNIVFYVNGVSVYSSTGTAITRTNTVWGIGHGVSNSELWNGRISSLAIYNRDLTGLEIASLYNSYEIYKVSISSQGNIIAIGAREYDGTTGTSTNIGATRIYKIDTAGNYTYAINNTAIADICGNIVLPKSVGSTTLTVTQSASGANTSKSTTIPFRISNITPTLSNFNALTKNMGSSPFILDDPYSNSIGTFTYTSSNTAVATLVTTNTTINALHFDGVNDTVVLSSYPALNSTNQLTLEGWIYITSYTKTVITLNGNSGIDILSDGKISTWVYLVGSGWFNLVSDSSVPLNSWVYIAVVKNDGGFNKMYINNTLVKNVADTTSGLFGSCIGASFAANAQSASGYSNISISEFRVWSIARTFNQLISNFNRQISSSESGLVIYYKFNQGTANGTNTGLTTLTDSTSNNYHGTLQGFGLSGTTSNWITGITRTSTTVSIVGVGTTTLTATQAASAQYSDASINTVLTVNSGTPTISDFATLNTFNVGYSINPLILVKPTSNSDGAFTYSINVDASNIATVLGSVVTLKAVGTATITATQEASGNYTSGSTSAILTISLGTPILLRNAPYSSANITKNYGDGQFTLVASSDSSGAILYSSNTPSVASINSSTGVVTVGVLGTATITVSQAATNKYNAPSNITWVVDVSRGNIPMTGMPSTLSVNITAVPFTLTATGGNGAAITYSSNNTAVASVSDISGVVTLKAPGTVSIIATQQATALYNSTTLATVVTVVGGGSLLAGQVVSTSRNFSGMDLSGVSFAGSTISNISFVGASIAYGNLSGAIIVNTDFTNTNIYGANITNVSFTQIQKIQLLKNPNNRNISGIQLTEVSGNTISPLVPQNSQLLNVENFGNLSFKIVLPFTSPSPTTLLANSTISDVSGAFYMPINDNEYFQINNVKYYVSNSLVKNYSTNETVELVASEGKYFKVYAGSFAGVQVDLNTFTVKNVGLGNLMQSNFNRLFILDLSSGLLTGSNGYSFTNNTFRIPYLAWDFDNYEYDIELQITTNYTGVAPWSNLYWSINSDDSGGTRYYNTYQDVLANGTGVSGINNSAYVHNLQSSNNIIQHYCRMKLYKVGDLFTSSFATQLPKLVLDSTTTSTALTGSTTSGDVTSGWTSRSMSTYTNSTTYNACTVDFYVNGSGWTTNSQCYYRLKQRTR